jgi:hypothetical protein
MRLRKKEGVDLVEKETPESKDPAGPPGAGPGTASRSVEPVVSGAGLSGDLLEFTGGL